MDSHFLELRQLVPDQEVWGFWNRRIFVDRVEGIIRIRLEATTGADSKGEHQREFEAARAGRMKTIKIFQLGLAVAKRIRF